MQKQLDKNWQFRQSGSTEWLPAQVPGCVHTDLLTNEKIDDPFYRDNEKKLQWIGKTDWEYQSIFIISAETMKGGHVDLVFDGLDTYARVFLNDVKILDADNMFRQWRVGTKAFLKEGGNTLRIIFRSPINEMLPKMKTMKIKLPAANDQPDQTSPYTRKAPYHFGWDWGPRLVTCGIWKPIYMEVWDDAKIDDVYFVQNSITQEKALLTAKVAIRASAKMSANLIVSSHDGRFSSMKISVNLQPGENTIELDFEIPEPELWWPNGYGEQPLYKIRITLAYGDREMDTASRRIGLRELKVRREKDQWGRSFTFVVNGTPVFAKGGNWIPADSFLNRVDKSRYEYLLKSCRDANMNMLRVWGGGIYEDDAFYGLCDELGILVWQDFMFSCSMYPGDDAFLENVTQEAIDNVKRLRHHPSIALWCGNNEMEWGWEIWGWKEKYPPELKENYNTLFYKILPQVCAALDAGRIYWPSSPSSYPEDDPNSQNTGDMHYWDVWHKAEPFATYEKQFPRFMSEYGFQSFPLLKTVNQYALPQDHDIESPVMMAHQKHPRGNQLIREYMLRHYPEPKDFASFLYVSQILQAEAIKQGAEHLRRIRPRCMGSLYWQINDCWPVASWSSIDYFGRWKALHYYAKKFYNDVLISPHKKNGKINIHIVSDRTSSFNAVVKTSLIDFSGKTLFEKTIDIRVEPLSSRIYAEFYQRDIYKYGDRKSLVLYCEIRQNGRMIASNCFYFEPFINLKLSKPTVTAEFVAKKNGFIIKLTSDRLAKNVYLETLKYDGFFSDNFFDMIPGKSVQVGFKAKDEITVQALERDMQITTLLDAF